MSAAEPTPDVPRTAPAREWRRVHPITPVVRGWAVIAVLLFVVGQQLAEGVEYADAVVDGVAQVWWIVVVLVVVLLAVIFGVSALAWRMTSYAVDDDAAHLRRGILFRQQRHARLDRLQAVDVRQPLLARLFGLAELTLEVAGGSDSGVVIGFLRLDDAKQLRAELLARAAGVKARRTDGQTVGAGDGAGGAASPTASSHDSPPAEVAEPAQEAPENLVYEVPPGRLVVSLLRLPAVWIALAVLIGLVVFVAATQAVGVLFSMLPVALGVGTFLFNRFAGEFGFRAAISPDGIRLRHGLLETRAQTIPPGRVQALELTQGLWWRGKDWWRITVNVAGYGSEDQNGTQNVLLPVGPRSEALAALWLVLPDLGADELTELLDEGLAGDSRTDRFFTTSPRRARLLDPLSWRRNGFAVADRALLLRGGRLTRRLSVVPHERTQSLGLEQGPWQRGRGLATFAVHSTPGPVTTRSHHLDAPDAVHLLSEQAVRARSARAHQVPERWMERVAPLARSRPTDGDAEETP
ncbi:MULTISPECIES: PH domain-containing protein [unclassified Isoptericola]|uniref:PH domain-containing protein n=1 Tax=unclassified Isoptericola TaxID=2623355 RepID=UPI002712582C|nr:MULTISPECIES: PH domain-containing protein [unclassified Isoptericola]MDO8143866.1 PH domain-containing protein [Isoptericola sp. 178]MDO8149290.1 PH domain-containing protein [Isoptericola sp. b515]MDO8152229.1 PH domain-containing protein [Isoptericola sp. b408]